MTDLCANVVVPLATDDDAAVTARALAEVLPDGATVTAVHVIEKAGGVPDKASPEARQEQAAGIFETFREALTAEGVDATVATRSIFRTGVVDGIIEVAREVDASAIVFVPRGGSRLVQFLTGDVALGLLEAADRPVVSLPSPDGEGNTDVVAEGTPDDE